jgi:phosphate transport system ATP-binding protein
MSQSELKILDPVLDIEHLHLFYGEAEALADISLSIPRRKATAFNRPTGRGTSTLLRCLNRITDLIENVRIQGEIKLDGDNIKAPDLELIRLRRRVGMVFQKSNPLPKTI